MFAKWFNKKGKSDEINPINDKNTDWSFLGADMHSHFIPGIDDGSKTIEESLLLIRSMVEMGFKTIITTPHIMIDYYPNNIDIITNGLILLQNALKENNIDITIRAAAEYYIDEYFSDKLDNEPLLTINKNEVLVEFSMLFEPPMLNEVLFKMLKKGYRPILAHPERYLFFHRDFDRFSEFRDRGCLLQLNLLSLTGYYGNNIKNIAEQILDKKMYDYCGTDIHHEKHALAIKSMIGTKAYQMLSNYSFLNSAITS